MPCLVTLLLFALFSIQGAKAQNVIVEPLKMEVKESIINDQILSHVVKIVNNSDENFSGTLKFYSKSDINLITRNDRTVTVAPGDSTFYAFKLVVDKNISAGTKTYDYILTDKDSKEILVNKMTYEVEVRENIHFVSDETPIMILNHEDSVRITVSLKNMGNRVEDVTLVFNVPEIRGVPQFGEIKMSVDPMTLMTYTYSFIPSNNLLQKGQFSVHIIGMKGKEKKLFGNRTITVQSVRSISRFNDIASYQSVFPSLGSYDNSLSLSYNRYGSTLYMMQLQGGGHYNLPAGYLQLKGNLYKYNSMKAPVVTNTSLMYKLYENEFSVGNLSEQMELPLFGRGANMKFSDRRKNRSVTIGAIDQNYNLFASQPWFRDYYSFYTKGEIGANNYYNGAVVSYLYQKNPYEGAEYHVSSLQLRASLGQNWNFEISTHGSIGKYDNLEDEKYTGAAELRYSGSVSDKIMLNGSGYYSDPYFPGSRRGTINISQSINYRFNDDINLSGSVGYNNTEPKSYKQNFNYKSENSNANLYLSLPRILRFSSSIYYRFQGEESSAYSQGFGDEVNNLPSSMESNRIGWQWRWQSARGKHSLLGNIEGGVFINPINNDPMIYNSINEGRNYQAKASLNYSYNWFSMDVLYQKGTYYLYENVMSQRLNKDFYRFTASASANKNISKRILLTSGINFTRDVYQGNVPSMNLSASWIIKDDFALFANSYWYQYPYINNKNIFNVQIGFTYTFSKSQPLSGKKGKISARIYYDHNANNKYDEGDEPAEGYLIKLNEKAFVSDKDGVVKYYHLPFGDYSVKPMRSEKWFFNQKDFEVDSYNKSLNIPLKQSGTVMGRIKYIAGELSMDVNERYEGLRFTIKNENSGTTHTVVTDGRGSFVTFLPNGIYTIKLSKNTLPDNTDCRNSEQIFQVEAGKTTNLEVFEIKVKERKINIKRF